MKISQRDQETIDAVLSHLVAETNAPSSMGSQLEQLSSKSDAKVHGPGWTTHAKPAPARVHNAEGTILRHASVYRILDSVARIHSVDLEVPMLVATTLADCSSIGVTVVRVLRAFQSALAAPSSEDLERANARASRVDVGRRDDVRQKALAEYRAPRGLDAIGRRYQIKSTADSAELYADCLLVLSMYVQQANRKDANAQ